MTRIIEMILSVVIVVVLFVGIALFLPNHAHVERSVDLSNPISQVFDTLNGFKRYNTWQPWYALDPKAGYQLSGPEFGPGAKISWNSNWDKQVGTGTLEVTSSEQDKNVIIAMTNDWYGKNKTMTMTLQQNPQTNAVKVIWSIDVDYGWDLMGRYAGLYLNGKVGEAMSSGLSKLGSFMATIPNLDYSQIDVQLAEAAPTDLLYVGGGSPAAPMKWDEAASKMDASWKEVDDYMKKAKIAATGPHRRIINVLGEEDNDFNLAVPVASTEGLSPTGNVKAGKAYAGKVLTTQYRGHRVGLIKPRDMLKAYALTHGYAFNADLAGVWEDWLPQETPESDPVTAIYLPIQ